MLQLAPPCSAQRQVAGPAAAAAETADRQALSVAVLASWRAAAWSCRQAGGNRVGRSSRHVEQCRTRQRRHPQVTVATQCSSSSSSSTSGGSGGGLNMQQNGSSLGQGQPSLIAAVAAQGAAPTGWLPLNSPSIWKVRHPTHCCTHHCRARGGGAPPARALSSFAAGRQACTWQLSPPPDMPDPARKPTASLPFRTPLHCCAGHRGAGCVPAGHPLPPQPHMEGAGRLRAQYSRAVA